MLVPHYVRRFNRELGREVREVPTEAMDLLRSYPWPGNIRELQSILKQALLRVTGPILAAESLPAPLSVIVDPSGIEGTAPDHGPARPPVESFLLRRMQECKEDLYQHVHSEIDQHLLPLVLRSTGGNQLQAARVLGITRRTLRLKLRELGLSVTKTVEAAESDDAD